VSLTSNNGYHLDHSDVTHPISGNNLSSFAQIHMPMDDSLHPVGAGLPAIAVYQQQMHV
jgi:hypothetical protein